MIILLFATVKLIQSCEYYCETCDSLQNFCSSCPETRQITQGDTGLSECLCKQNFVDIGGQECLQCPSNCVNCDSLDPSKCISCGNKDYTHRILGNSNQCVCEEGYFEVWYSYNCQNIQFNLQILQFKYILSQQLYVKRLQDKYSCSQKTVQGLDYMIKRGVVDDGTNSFQFISKLQQNEISSTVAPYPLGQYYIQQFQNLFALGIKLNHEQVALWAANVNSNDYTMYQGKRVIYHNTWKFVIYQFQLSNYDGNIFLQIALSENGEVKPENKNRLLESQLGNMALLYYLAYEHNYFLNELELNEIINDILYIQFQKPQNSLDYYYDGQALIILKCQVNYVLKNEECVCDNENGYYIYNGICKLQCPNDCLTCTKEVCLMFNNQIRCQEGYYLESNNKICLKCNSTCQTCMNDKVCTKCRENLILSNEQCLTCSEFQKQFMCDQYDSNCICTKCIEGFQLDQFSKCIKCPINCISCNFEDKCINCKEGYYFNNNQCIQCQENCILCQDQNYCIKSNKGYYVQKGILLQCTNNCLAFQNECQCENCLAKYYQDENDKLCYSCPVQCQTCSNQSTCQSCVSNSFYLEDSHCKECKTPCLTCLNQSKCLTCINEQYYYIQGEQKCIQCPTPCYQCYYDQNPLCINCLENFYLFNQQCYACPIYCKGTCQFDVTNKFIQCEQCSIGFYPSQINLPFDCINCSNNCINCTTEQTCLQCSSGYILRNGQCLNCSQIYESTCLDCNEQRCQNCQNGYKLMNGKCIQDVINEIPICQVKRQFYNILSNSCDSCQQNCMICKSQQICLTCEQQYYLKSDICINCKLPCNTCMSDQFCLTTSNQLYYVDLTIVDVNQINTFKCNPPCRNCYSNDECIDCIDGYYFDNNNCTICESSCKTCKNQNNFCTSCNSGYQLLNGSCHQCIDQNCENCHQFCSTCNHLENDLYKCSQCLQGYYLIDQECHQCNSNCKICSVKSDQCTSCIEGYFLTIDMKCEKCNQGCKSCQVQTKSCIQCEEGYFLQKQSDFLYQCVKCEQGCKSCDEGGCLVCIDQYYQAEDRKCEKCIAPCSTCTSSTQCTLCMSGYYYHNEKCEKCQENCQKCSSSNDCLVCQAPLFLFEKSCIKCSEHCITCNNSKCQQCEESYVLSIDGICQQHNLICNINKCSQCQNDTQCLECQDGYIVNIIKTECIIDSQIVNSKVMQENDNGKLLPIISISSISVISFAFIYLIYKCRQLNITIKVFQRKNDIVYPILPVIFSEPPAIN